MKCWSCGSDFAGGWPHFFTCPLCSQAESLKEIHNILESSIAPSLYRANRILEEGFNKLSGQFSEKLMNIASVIEWGFEEIEWNFDQMEGILISIDNTLKVPGMTQADEWRQIAEELRCRGVLNESEKFFLKSLERNPLDYRTYVGLGKTYLRLGMGEKARTYWEKSLLHTPRKEAGGAIDYKSYSYRLIGRLDFCEDKPRQAVLTLRKAIELSPNYYLGHYDHAQYCSLIGDKENCLTSLRIAITKMPISTRLVEEETNFSPLRKEIEILLGEIKSDEDSQREIQLRSRLQKLGAEGVEVLRNLDLAEQEIEGAERAIARVDKISEGEYRFILENHQLSVDYCRHAKRQLERAKRVAISSFATNGEIAAEMNRRLTEVTACALRAKEATVEEEYKYKKKTSHLSTQKKE